MIESHTDENRVMVWWTRLFSRRLQFLLDVAVLASAFVVAYSLRFDFDVPNNWRHNVLVQLPYVVLLQFLVLDLAKGRSFLWRYTGIAHLRPFLYTAGISFLLTGGLRVALPESYQQWRVPLSVSIIDTLFGIGSVLGLRILRRVLYERYEKRKSQRALGDSGYSGRQLSVLLIGAGQAGVLTAKEIERRADVDLLVKGFVDDDPAKQKRTVLQGIKVLGMTRDLPRLVHEMRIDRVVITMAQASRQDIRRIVEICERIPVKVQIIPGIYEILQGRVGVSRIRDVQIEDLLGREPVTLDTASLRSLLANKTVMVTGAGGSIGSELVRQVTKYNPVNLLLVERTENALFNIDRELRETHPQQSIEPLVADVGDAGRMRAIFAAYRPQVVLHAAAHKHVPLMEFNPGEAVKNNVLATRLLGELAGEFAAEVFVLISTDKAVRPSSIMGATKRLAELAVQELNRHFPTRYVIVRFGNVIGSAGSVIPIFREQIRKGGPLMITDKRMTRYFMTIPEASQLVLQAGAIGKNGTGGDEVYILQMGEPVRILELAETLITLSGFKPHEDIKIIETGRRPGEKLHEELRMSEEIVAETYHPKILVNKIAARPTEDVRHALERLASLSRNGYNREELCAVISELLPEARLETTAVNKTSSAKALSKPTSSNITTAVVAALTDV